MSSKKQKKEHKKKKKRKDGECEHSRIQNIVKRLICMHETIMYSTRNDHEPKEPKKERDSNETEYTQRRQVQKREDLIIHEPRQMMKVMLAKYKGERRNAFGAGFKGSQQAVKVMLQYWR